MVGSVRWVGMGTYAVDVGVDDEAAVLLQAHLRQARKAGGGHPFMGERGEGIPPPPPLPPFP